MFKEKKLFNIAIIFQLLSIFQVDDDNSIVASII